MLKTQRQLSDLETKGFTALKYPPKLRTDVDGVELSWRAFCDLPAEVKNQFPYSNDSDGVGYELKQGVGHKSDRKENFDVTRAGFGWLRYHAEKTGNPIISQFVESAVTLVDSARPLIVDFAGQVEEEFGVSGLRAEVESSTNSFFVRFIHYFGDGEEGAEIAVPHVDQSGFTPHLFESDPGLQCLNFDGNWIPMPVSHGQTVVIPSMQLQYRSEGVLKASCHRVVSTPKTAKEGRYAGVCFVQLAKTPKYDKAIWGRLQELVPGWNYTVSPADFKKYFKK